MSTTSQDGKTEEGSTVLLMEARINLVTRKREDLLENYMHTFTFGLTSLVSIRLV